MWQRLKQFISNFLKYLDQETDELPQQLQEVEKVTGDINSIAVDSSKLEHDLTSGES